MAPKLKARKPGQDWRHWDAYELQRRAIGPVADMELRGLGFNPAVHAEIVRNWSCEIAEQRDAYYGMTGRTPPATDPQRREWLKWVLSDDPQRLAQWPRTRTGELSVRSGHLKRLIDIESARPVLAMRAKEQLLSNFGPKLLQHVSPVTGRIHCRYNIAGTKAGRFSASSPNLQQFPSKRAPEFKDCIVAAPGNVLVACDWSQIEMRAAAWLYHDRALTQVFVDGRDIHVETAARIAGIPVAQVTDEQRQKAKPVNYGAIYGQGPEGLREYAFTDYGVEMTLREAEHAQQRFFAAHPQLREGLRRNYGICRARGYVLIGAGRIVQAEWEEDVSGQLLFTRCCNLPVQGISADAMLRAIPLTYNLLRESGIRGGLVACVHDELALEVHEDDAEKAREILTLAMTRAFIETFPGAPANGVAMAKSGRTWAEVR